MTDTVLAVLVAMIAGGGAAALAWPASGPAAPASGQSRAAVGLLGACAIVAAVGPGEILRMVGGVPGRAAPLLLAAAAVIAGLWLRRGARARRVRARRGADVLELCDDLAGDLQAGAAPGVALQRAATRWPEFAGPASVHALGGSVPRAWRELSGLPGAADLQMVAAAWQVAERTGAGLAEALVAVGSGLRDQQRTRRLVASELASARATARLMAALPLLTLAVGSGAGDPVGFLLGTPVGLACATVGLALEFAGVAWIEAIASGLEKETR